MTKGTTDMTKSIYFTSDLHLGHKRIFQFGQRKHNSLQEMHEVMVEEWNSKVTKNSSIVYVLGDVCMNIEEMHWLDKMNGQKRLIMGNHDTLDYNVYRKHFKKIQYFHKAYKGLVLTHIPIHPQEMTNRNWDFNIHGHIHEPTKDIKDPRYFNVNMDIIGYKPIKLEELREKLNERIL